MPDTLEISPEKLQIWLGGEAPPQLLDVREPAEWRQTGVLAGSFFLPLGQLNAATLAQLLTKKRPVVAICHSGFRSLTAAKKLQAAGYHACSLAGGVAGWAASFPLVPFLS